MLENKITEAMKKKKKKLDPVGQEDGDIDNDGDEDETDGYLRNRRNAVRKAIMGKKHEASPLFTPKEKKASKEAPSILRKPGDTSPAIPGGRKPARFQFDSDKVDTTKPIVPAERKKHPNIQVASTEIIGQKIIEGFKRACWGDRYDEKKFEDLTPDEQIAMAQKARARRSAAGKPAALNTQGAAQTVANNEKLRLARGGAGRDQSKDRNSTTLDKFADVIRERCWKGYKPVKGKKPYSKGSCTKEAYERFGKAIIEALNNLKENDGQKKETKPTRTVGGSLGAAGQGQMSPEDFKKAISYTPEEIKSNDAANERARKLRGRPRSDI